MLTGENVENNPILRRDLNVLANQAQTELTSHPEESAASTTSSLEPSSQTLVDQLSRSDVNYRLDRNLSTVQEVVMEHFDGLLRENGTRSPSVCSMDDRFGDSWRLEPAERQYYSRNMRLISVVKAYMRLNSVTAHAAASHFERERINSNQTLRNYIRGLPSSRSTSSE